MPLTSARIMFYKSAYADILSSDILSLQASWKIVAVF